MEALEIIKLLDQLLDAQRRRRMQERRQRIQCRRIYTSRTGGRAARFTVDPTAGSSEFSGSGITLSTPSRSQGDCMHTFGGSGGPSAPPSLAGAFSACHATEGWANQLIGGELFSTSQPRSTDSPKTRRSPVPYSMAPVSPTGMFAFTAATASWGTV